MIILDNCFKVMKNKGNKLFFYVRILAESRATRSPRRTSLESYPHSYPQVILWINGGKGWI